MDKKILVVDDSSTMRRIISKSLIELGVNPDFITPAADGFEALEKLKAAVSFDLILTDWNMPNMDGLTLVHSLRKIPESAKTPIVMITTEGNKKDVIEALKSGVNNYIVKPFTADSLKVKLLPVLSSLK